MVMADLQVRDVELLRSILLLHVERERLPWYLASYLKISVPRPAVTRLLDAAPDLLMVEAEDRLRTSWNIREEGKPPQFVLEVATGSSWGRDTEDKPLIYGSMGVGEYAIFAPERRDGPVLFGYRRGASGTFDAWTPDERGVLWSRELAGLGLYVEERLWLRVQDADGRRLPTPRELAAEEAAARATDSVRLQLAEAEVVRLREEIRRLRET